jgi:hypothetical protein
MNNNNSIMMMTSSDQAPGSNPLSLKPLVAGKENGDAHNNNNSEEGGGDPGI